MTISNLSPADQAFLAGVNTVEQQITAATQHITSGLKVSTAADDPAQIDDLLQLRADQQLDKQVASNLTMANSVASAADTAIGGAVQVVDTAIQIATQAANSLTGENTDSSLALQVQGLLSQMVNYSQTQVQGQYIFSGDQPESPYYQLDLAAPQGVDQLLTAGATQQIQDPAGGSFAVSQTAQTIFGNQNADGTPAGDNVFAALNNLNNALQSNSTAGVKSALNNLQQASTRLNDMQSFYGVVEDRIQSATTYSSSRDTELETQIGSIQDADVTSDAMLLSQANTQLQAAFQAEAQIPKSTLFNYLS
ncbi:MAG TPA: flagellin [Bryobacteraceae bacterium]|jgi:flagellin-like hook-associated protein FlgL